MWSHSSVGFHINQANSRLLNCKEETSLTKWLDGVRAMFPAVYKHVWAPVLHNTIPLFHDDVPSRLPCGVEGLGCWNVGGVSQVSGVFCTRLLRGVPGVRSVPSAHSVGRSFLGLSPIFSHLTSSLLLFVLRLFPHPSYQFWYLDGGSVIHPLPFPPFPQVPWPKSHGKEKISSI